LKVECDQDSSSQGFRVTATIGRRDQNQGWLFYAFRLDNVVLDEAERGSLDCRAGRRRASSAQRLAAICPQRQARDNEVGDLVARSAPYNFAAIAQSDARLPDRSETVYFSPRASRRG
jgi:hypothetical protein